MSMTAAGKRYRRRVWQEEKRQGSYALLVNRYGPFEDAEHAYKVLRKVPNWGWNGYRKFRCGRVRLEWLHRAVMMVKLRRNLRRGEVVHHRDGNCRNNHPANLELCMDPLAHFEKHGLGRGVFWRYGLRWYSTGPSKGRSVARVMMELALRRRLRRSEIVWHKNGRRGDDRVENMEVVTRAEMMRRNRANGEGKQ